MEQLGRGTTNALGACRYYTFFSSQAHFFLFLTKSDCGYIGNMGACCCNNHQSQYCVIYILTLYWTFVELNL